MPRTLIRNSLRLIGAFMGLVVLAAHADEVERGKELAARWCTDCHVIASDEPGGDVGPPFPMIAVRNGQSKTALNTWLADPHPPMPNLGLTASEFEALTDYIWSLRRAD